MKFVDLADGGRRLAPLVADAIDAADAADPDTVLVSIGDGGRVTGAALAETLGHVVTHLPTTRTDDGVRVDLSGVALEERAVIVVDDGVETGTAAHAAGAAIRGAGAVRVVLAVPVCPRESEAHLRQRYDDVIAVTKPLVRRSLRWHYETFA